MGLSARLKHVGTELKAHAPFTIGGALTGIVLMVAFRAVTKSTEHAGTLFSIFHPLHVFLSAFVTASLFRLHRNTRNFLLLLVVGWLGAIGVATLSDSIIPFFGESILGVSVPTHAAVHEHAHEEEHGGHPGPVEHTEHAEHSDHDIHMNHSDEDMHVHVHEHEHEHPRWHIGFIEEWYIVNPAVLIGVLLAYIRPRTKFPHATHVLLSTWASSAHIMMNTRAELTPLMVVGIFVVLFIAVWLPCCLSDIVFPVLLVKPELCSVCGHTHGVDTKHEG